MGQFLNRQSPRNGTLDDHRSGLLSTDQALVGRVFNTLWPQSPSQTSPHQQSPRSFHQPKPLLLQVVQPGLAFFNQFLQGLTQNLTFLAQPRDGTKTILARRVNLLLVGHLM